MVVADPFWSNFANFWGRILAGSEHSGLELDQIWVDFDQMWLTSSKFGPISSRLGPARLDLCQIRSRRAWIWARRMQVFARPPRRTHEDPLWSRFQQRPRLAPRLSINCDERCAASGDHGHNVHYDTPWHSLDMAPPLEESIGEYFLVPLCMSAFHGPQEVTKAWRASGEGAHPPELSGMGRCAERRRLP